MNNIRHLLCVCILFDLLSAIETFLYNIGNLLYVYWLTFSALFTPCEATRSSNAWVRWCYKKLQRLWSSLQRIWGMLKLFGYSLNYWSPYFSCESILPQIQNISKPRPPIIFRKSPTYSSKVALTRSVLHHHKPLPPAIDRFFWTGSLDSQTQRHGRQLNITI